jgi:hypothetical protein
MTLRWVGQLMEGLNLTLCAIGWTAQITPITHRRKLAIYDSDTAYTVGYAVE